MFEGNREHDYRQQSAKNAGAMNGVVRCIFVCRVCKDSKPITGRKMMVMGYSKAGYRCAECVAKREAA